MPSEHWWVQAKWELPWAQPLAHKCDLVVMMWERLLALQSALELAYASAMASAPRLAQMLAQVLDQQLEQKWALVLVLLLEYMCDLVVTQLVLEWARW